MTTDTAQPLAADTAPATEQWLTGDYYHETAAWSMDQVADRVCQDLYDVRYDDLVPATAEFDVTPDTDGTVPVLRVTISGLVYTLDPSVTYNAMRTAFGLANHYNRVNLTRPERTRFIQHITALRPDGTPAVLLIGMMHDALPAHHTHATTATGTGTVVPAVPVTQPQHHPGAELHAPQFPRPVTDDRP